ncbi:MAG: glycosyltransferase family 9 protein, partial [Acidobacteriota bacterium]
MNPENVQRVLVYRLGSLGDTVVALPALHLIERTFPAARRLLLTNMPAHVKAPAAFAVLRGSNLVHDFINYPVATRNPLEVSSVWWKIRRFHPQVVVYLMSQRGEHSLQRDEWFFRICGARSVVGLPEGDLNTRIFDPETGLWEHEAARLVRCLRDLGDIDPTDLANWDLRLTLAEEQKAREVLAVFDGAPFIVCGPGTKMQAKDWGQENWRELLGRISDRLPHHALLLIGSGEDSAIAADAGAAWHGPVLNLCGSLTPRQSAAVLRHGELFLGPDSGPMHLAAAYGVPCAIPFAARQDPGVWYPVGSQHRVVYHSVECRNCLLEVCTEKKKICLTSISVEEMLAAAMDAWQNGHTRKKAEL